ncbi:MarR family transcriptional regulator [Arthrobacter sp. NEB 688]|uniref:GbsR/MarR family transcriptional regulator n=1 Tax=Arthrobacter sp. NEB 688 TaxID=904039 RepID=UPI00156719F6|nr:MarR family transcriptional regulator [Arthrobacter sp. NEB 688]QKE85613.1 MarR family transcriptional regulator [Arthrobacter sp. NEB 688]
MATPDPSAAAPPDAALVEAALPDAAVAERIGATLAELGMQLQPARVFAALLATEDGRLTSAQLVALLGISPAAVSGAVRFLTQVRMVRRERERGGRRDVYVVQDDAWHDVMVQKESVYGPLVLALAAGRDAVGAGTRAGERLQLSVEFLEFVMAEMEQMAERWERHKAGRAAVRG